MNLKKYRYHGPTSSCSLRMGNTLLDVMLHEGRDILLPVDHEYTQAMLVQGHLTVVTEPAAYHSETIQNTQVKPSSTKGKSSGTQSTQAAQES